MTTDIVGSREPSFASDALKEDKRGLGQNGYGGASSDLPGQRTRADMTVNKDDTDPVLATVKAKGTYRTDVATDDKQLRDIAGKECRRSSERC